MAWSEKLPNGNYRGCWRDATGAKRSATTDDEGKKFTQPKAAKNYAIYREGSVRADAPQRPKAGSLTWGHWCEEWLQIRRVEPSTARSDRGRLNAHLHPRWDNVRLTKITDMDVQAWVNQLADRDDLSPSTVQRIFHLFSASMKAAVRAKRLQINPCIGTAIPASPPAQEHYITEQQFWKIHSYMNPPYADALVILVFTGVRFGEMAGLHWSRVDLDRKQLQVAETWDSAAQRIKGYPKSRKPRNLPLVQDVLDVLMKLPPDQGGCGLPHAAGSRCDSSLVLTSSTGLMPVDSSAMRREFNRAVAASGVGHTRIHDLRHSFGSWLVQKGVPLTVVQELMGHASLVTTQRYAHFGPGRFEQVIAALEE